MKTFTAEAQRARRKKTKLSVLSVSAVQNHIDMTIVLRVASWVTYGKRYTINLWKIALIPMSF